MKVHKFTRTQAGMKFWKKYLAWRQGQYVQKLITDQHWYIKPLARMINFFPWDKSQLYSKFSWRTTTHYSTRCFFSFAKLSSLVDRRKKIQCNDSYIGHTSTRHGRQTQQAHKLKSQQQTVCRTTTNGKQASYICHHGMLKSFSTVPSEWNLSFRGISSDQRGCTLFPLSTSYINNNYPPLLQIIPLLVCPCRTLLRLKALNVPRSDTQLPLKCICLCAAGILCCTIGGRRGPEIT
jgi:hypothetical protein